MQPKRLYHLLDLRDSSLSSSKIFSREVPCMATVIATAALYWTNSSFSQNYSLWGWS